MARNQELDIGIMQRIFWHFYSSTAQDEHGVKVVQRLLPLAAVCQPWRVLMLPYAYKTAYLELPTDCYTEEVGWKSNIGLVVSQKRSHSVSKLVLLVTERHSNILIPDGLDSFGFSSTRWINVTKLAIAEEYSHYRRHHPLGNDDTGAQSTRLTNYFVRHVPNLRCMSLDVHSHRAVNRNFANKMISAYMSQLHRLDSGNRVPIAFSARRFGESIAHLRLRISTDITNMFPQMLASQLHSLTLHDIPSHFTWKAFASESPECILFANLRELRLSFSSEKPNRFLYKYAKDEAKIVEIVARDSGYRQLRFPVLRSLMLERNPYNDTAFYKVFESSPLRDMNIKCSFSAMKSIGMSTLANLPQFELDIHSIQEGELGELGSFTEQLFGSSAGAEKARLTLFGSIPLLAIPGKIAWSNIRVLVISARVYLSSFIKFATQCPRLTRLSVEGVVSDLEDFDAALNQMLISDSAHTKCISTVLEHLRVDDHGSCTMYFSLNVLVYMILTVRSLRKVHIPSMSVSRVEGFIASCSASFPHLRHVGVCGNRYISGSREDFFESEKYRPFDF